MSFDNLGLSSILNHNLHDLGYRVPTPVQVQAIPLALEGRDLLGSAQTDTGKTAAFGLPMIERLVLRRKDGAGTSLVPRKPLALVLTPTR
jgi:ATP-dependent RNA helicase RhlE